MAATKVKFFSRTNLPLYSVTPVGSKMRNEFIEVLDDEGIPTLKVKGEYDFQAQIDSFADECDIYKILDRLGVSLNDPDVVQQAISQFRPDMFVPGKFGDFTNLPKNIHEVAKFHRDALEFFNSLPADVRAEYGYSADRFFANFDDFVAKYNSPAPSTEPVVQSTEGGTSNE